MGGKRGSGRRRGDRRRAAVSGSTLGMVEPAMGVRSQRAVPRLHRSGSRLGLGERLERGGPGRDGRLGGGEKRDKLGLCRRVELGLLGSRRGRSGHGENHRGKEHKAEYTRHDWDLQVGGDIPPVDGNGGKRTEFTRSPTKSHAPFLDIFSETSRGSPPRIGFTPISPEGTPVNRKRRKTLEGKVLRANSLSFSIDLRPIGLGRGNAGREVSDGSPGCRGSCPLRLTYVPSGL